MIDVKSYDNLRYSKRDDDPIIIVNKGPKLKGFMVCKECGAAVPGDDPAPLSKLFKPFVHPHNNFYCRHPASQITNTYLGSQFRTDMVVYEIALPYDKINVDPQELWIHRAGQTMAEAMTLAGGRLWTSNSMKYEAVIVCVTIMHRKKPLLMFSYLTVCQAVRVTVLH